MTFKVVQGNVKEGIPISKAIIAGDYIFVSGEVAFDDTGEIVKGGIEAETRQQNRTWEKIIGLSRKNDGVGI